MSAKDDISISDYRALAEFRYRIRQFQRFSEQVSRTAGVEPQQHQTLLVIKGMPEEKTATIGDVAERLQIQHHSAVELVDRLEERGLVERRRDEADQRRVFVHLTQQGEEILRNISHHTLTELRTNGPALVGALNALLVGIINGKDSQDDLRV